MSNGDGLTDVLKLPFNCYFFGGHSLRLSEIDLVS